MTNKLKEKIKNYLIEQGYRDLTNFEVFDWFVYGLVNFIDENFEEINENENEYPENFTYKNLEFNRQSLDDNFVNYEIIHIPTNCISGEISIPRDNRQNYWFTCEEIDRDCILELMNIPAALEKIFKI